MTDAIIRFADTNPWLTFSMFWLAVHGVVQIVYMPLKLVNRILRHRNILKHGYPTAPVDADGDVILPDADN